MFLKQYDKDHLQKALLPLEEWRPFPPADDRLAWDKLLEAPLNRQSMKRPMPIFNAAAPLGCGSAASISANIALNFRGASVAVKSCLSISV